MVIRKVPGKRQYILRSKSTGRELGRFPSKKKALAREKQIGFFKCVSAGKCKRRK